LIDPFGRQIKYLRLSVTDRCDLRCSYCIPVGFVDYEEPKDWLTFDEIERVAKAFASLGVESIRITGGEPLLRKDLTSLVSRISSIDGVNDLSLSTNGTQLLRHAIGLKQAGLNRINVSLDSLSPERFKELCGRDALDRVIYGLERAKSVGLGPIKINSVFMPESTDAEIDDLVEYCMRNAFVLRLIEVMPVGDTGRKVGSSCLQSTMRRLQNEFGLVESTERGPGPAKYLVSSDNHFKVGFITPMSQHFCETCNRVRLSVDGTLYLCLGQNDKFELRPILRGGASHHELTEAIRLAITMKPEKHEFNESPDKIVRIMARTGG
jgi:GTP 3',8-cyclase